MVVRTASTPDDFLGIAAPLCPTEQLAAALVELTAVRPAAEAVEGVPASARDWTVTISAAIKPMMAISATHGFRGASGGLYFTGASSISSSSSVTGRCCAGPRTEPADEVARRPDDFGA